GDNTDRLIVERQVAGCDVAPTAVTIDVESGDELITTPADIVALRQSNSVDDQARARDLRVAQRKSFESAFSASKFVRGFTADGAYVLSEKAR
ncbi:MAG: hypothetical protein EB035_07565, partial [Actinobacteria bacterium]|nr:hypothetical protein [Actinomycetota bacterium]NDD73332.1 hypothetical protein [Actinomycetota bacterium]